MSALRTILGGILDGMVPDTVTARHRVELRVHTIVTLAATALALVLTVAYQVLRYLPHSWRRSLVDLLGGAAEPTQE